MMPKEVPHWGVINKSMPTVTPPKLRKNHRVFFYVLQKCCITNICGFSPKVIPKFHLWDYWWTMDLDSDWILPMELDRSSSAACFVYDFVSFNHILMLPLTFTNNQQLINYLFRDFHSIPNESNPVLKMLNLRHGHPNGQGCFCLTSIVGDDHRVLAHPTLMIQQNLREGFSPT